MIILSVLFLAGLFIYTATRPQPDIFKDDAVRQVRIRGALRVAVRSDVPGFADAGGGLEIELARRLSQKLFDGETRLELIPSSARTALPKLDRDFADVTLALCRYTPTNSRYSYSLPYFTDAYAFLVLAGTPRLAPDAVIGVMQTSSAEAALTAYAQEKEFVFTVKKYASYEDLEAALHQGEIAAAGMEAAVLARCLDASETVLPESFGTLRYALAAPQKNAALAEIASIMIQELETSGELARLTAQYNLRDYSEIVE